MRYSLWTRWKILADDKVLKIGMKTDLDGSEWSTAEENMSNFTDGIKNNSGVLFSS